MGYIYYRNSLIKVALLSVACLGIFWDYFTGKSHPGTEHGVLILIAVIIVVGNVTLFVLMQRAKRREQAENAAEAQGASQRNKPRPTPEEVIRKRKGMRRFMSFWGIAGGLVFVIFGREWLVNGLPVHWVGFALILLGILGLAGVNVFYGGPLDLRLDKQHPSHDQSTGSNEHAEN